MDVVVDTHWHQSPIGIPAVILAVAPPKNL